MSQEIAGKTSADLGHHFHPSSPSLTTTSQLPLNPPLPTDHDSPTVITPSLYLGSGTNASSASLLQSLSITHVISVTPSYIPFPQLFTYLHIPVLDVPHEYLTPYFLEVAKFAADSQASGGKTFIHCDFGISRSVTFVVACMMINSSLPVLAALDQVRLLRREAEPNPGFLNQLRKLEIGLARPKPSQWTAALGKGVNSNPDLADTDPFLFAILKTTSLHAVNHLPPDSLQGYEDTTLALLPTQNTLEQLTKAWFWVVEHYAGVSERDDRARDQFAMVWWRAMRAGVVGDEETKDMLDGIGAAAETSNSEEGGLAEQWRDLKIDVPYANRHLERLLEELGY